MAAGAIEVGDGLRATSPGCAKVLLERETDPLDAPVGDLRGIYEEGDLEPLRDEWA